MAYTSDVKHLRIPFLLCLLLVLNCSAYLPGANDHSVSAESGLQDTRRTAVIGPSISLPPHTATAEQVVPVIAVPSLAKGANDRYVDREGPQCEHAQEVRTGTEPTRVFSLEQHRADRQARILFPFHFFW